MIHNSAVPMASYQSVPFLAQLIACGLIGRAEALAALVQGISSPLVSPDGRQARLVHTLGTVSSTTPCSRTIAAKLVREAITPLLIIGTPKSALVASASRAAGQKLRPSEIEQLITEAVSLHLRNRRLKRFKTQ